MSRQVKMWVSLMLIMLSAYALYLMISTNKQSPKKTTGLDLDAYEMTSQQAEPFPFTQLKGKVWIASLFFSSCPHQCKSLNTAIASLNRDPEFKDVQFVSISVDPAVDSPKTLAEYAQLFDADPEKWLFLTGNLQQVGRFGRAIKVPAGHKTHTRSLVLFDRNGKVRGQFRFNDAADMARLKAELPAILAEPNDAEKATEQKAPQSEATELLNPAFVDGEQAV